MDNTSAPTTNRSSNFTPFSLLLSNNATLTGIAHIPPLTAWKGSGSRPLIVALHGGTCTAHHYDIAPMHTASTTSAATGIPFVSIDRPCYGGTSSFLPFPEPTTTTSSKEEENGKENSFFQTTAEWLHRFILPGLWRDFGVPNTCGGVVLLSHSLAVPPSILVAGMYATEATTTTSLSSNSEALHPPPPPPSYPLAGLILSGFGAPGTTNNIPHPISTTTSTTTSTTATTSLTVPPPTKHLMMLSSPSLSCAPPHLFPLITLQSVPMPPQEGNDALTFWPSRWEAAAGQVKVPVLHRMGEHDWLWKSDEESMRVFRGAFRGCKRFEGGVVGGAPHALEMGVGGEEWYGEVFGFAGEVCA